MYILEEIRDSGSKIATITEPSGDVIGTDRSMMFVGWCAVAALPANDDVRGVKLSAAWSPQPRTVECAPSYRDNGTRLSASRSLVRNVAEVSNELKRWTRADMMWDQVEVVGSLDTCSKWS